MKKLTTLIALTFPLMIGTTAMAQLDPDAREADAEVMELVRAHDESELGYSRAYEEFRPRFVKFAETHRDTEAEVRAMLWLVQQTWWLRQKGTMEETSFPLAEDLLERHMKSPQLELLVEYQYVFNKEQRQELFSQLIDDSPHKEVKAAAHYGLARLASARTSDGEPNPHYQALMNEYADVRWRFSTFGAIADAQLNPHSSDALAVGSEAPEITGVNHEGKPMKLSDYRGKVIMLDFWGHW